MGAGIAYENIVVQLILLVLAILFFVTLCLFLLNYLLRGFRKSKKLNEMNHKLDKLMKEKNNEEIK